MRVTDTYFCLSFLTALAVQEIQLLFRIIKNKAYSNADFEQQKSPYRAIRALMFIRAVRSTNILISYFKLCLYI